MPDLSTLTFGPEERDQAFLLHPSPALVFDPATRRILAANVAAATLYGWTRDELATMTLDDIRPPEARPLLLEQRRQRDEGAPSHWMRTTHWKRTGEPIEVEVLTQPMRLDGQPVRRAMIL